MRFGKGLLLILVAAVVTTCAMAGEGGYQEVGACPNNACGSTGRECGFQPGFKCCFVDNQCVTVQCGQPCPQDSQTSLEERASKAGAPVRLGAGPGSHLRTRILSGGCAAPSGSEP